MAFIEGATFSGQFSELMVATNYTKPSNKQGASIGGHSVGTKSQANINSGVTKVGAMVVVYAPALSVLFGTDDF